MKKTHASAFVAILVAGFLAGCNNNSSSPSLPGTGTNCGNPPANFQVLYPENNAKLVSPSGANTIYVASKPALPASSSYNFGAQFSNGSTQFTSVFQSFSGSVGSIPTPHASPAPGATLYTTQFNYPLAPLQTVQLFWNDSGTGCNPNVLVSSFTTGS